MQRAGVRAWSLGVISNKKKNAHKYTRHIYKHTHVNTYTYTRGVAGDGLPIFAGSFHL